MPTITTQNTVLKRGDGASPEVFTTVAQITSINGVGFSRSLIDVTNLSSTSRQYRLAIKDGREMTIEFQLDESNTQQTGLRDDLNAGIERRFEIHEADVDETVYSFPALVTDWSWNAPIDDVIRGSVTLKPTGDIVITQGS